jgi:hypothetical protein
LTETFIRQDEITLQDRNIEAIYDLILKWLKLRGFRIRLEEPTTQIIGEYRMGGGSPTIRQLYKDVKFKLSNEDEHISIHTTLYMPYRLNEKQVAEAKYIWGEYLEKVYRFIGIDVNNTILNKIHTKEYYEYKQNEYVKSMMILIIMIIITNYYVYTELILVSALFYLLPLMLVADMVLIYLLHKGKSVKKR